MNGDFTPLIGTTVILIMFVAFVYWVRRRLRQYEESKNDNLPYVIRF